MDFNPGINQITVIEMEMEMHFNMWRVVALIEDFYEKVGSKHSKFKNIHITKSEI